MADKVLMLRTCEANMTSRNGRFAWPDSGPVEAPDWRDDALCGHGLHGLLWGEGHAYHLLSRASDAKWLVVEVERSDIRDVCGTHKFSRGEVILCGSREEAVECIQRAAPGNAFNYEITTAGNFGTTTAGDWGTTIAGDFGTATAGIVGIAIAGDGGTAIAGRWGASNAGIEGTATAGDEGTATAGDYGTATVGNEGTATAGYRGTATAGIEGIAITGDEGTATAGRGGVLIGIFRDAEGVSERRAAIVGQEGILPNTPYRCVQGEWVEV